MRFIVFLRNGKPKPPTVTGVFLFAKTMDYIITNHLTEQEAKDMLKDAAQDYRLTLSELGMISRLLNSDYTVSYYSIIRKKTRLEFFSIEVIMQKLSKRGYCKGLKNELPNDVIELWTLTPYYKSKQQNNHQP
jgi:hypothetical protein